MAPGVTAPVTAIVTGHRRVDDLLSTLRILSECDPAPAEILVHVDGGERGTAAAVNRAYPSIHVVVSPERVGPGGGRNRLLAIAAHPLVASFDDDSYPVDSDYFARVVRVFEEFPDAAIIDAQVFHLNEAIAPDRRAAMWVADFSGGACAYRRDWFLKTGGYLPLPLAYGMEEVDLGLRVHAMGGRVLRSSWLRVFHNTDLARHALPEVTSASVANLALLTYLRYPVALWIVGAGQILNRVQWLMRHGRRAGIVSGLIHIPAHLAHHRHYRQPLPMATVQSFLSLRRQPVPA